MFPGFNAPQDGRADYDYRIRDDLSFVILYRGEEVYESRQYRLKVQAEEGARDWIKNKLGTTPSDITLDIHKANTGGNTKFRRN